MNVSKVFDEICARVDRENLIHSCSGEGCTVYMNGIPTARIVVHVEREFDAHAPIDILPHAQAWGFFTALPKLPYCGGIPLDRGMCGRRATRRLPKHFGSYIHSPQELMSQLTR